MTGPGDDRPGGGPGGDQGDWTTGGAGLPVHSCAACGHRWYFARPFCPRCGSTAVVQAPSRCLGTVHALTRVDRAPSPEWRDHAPYGIALVDLDEGVRVMTHAAPGLRIGERVRITFQPAPGGAPGRTIPYAEAAPPAGGDAA